MVQPGTVAGQRHHAEHQPADHAGEDLAQTDAVSADSSTASSQNPGSTHTLVTYMSLVMLQSVVDFRGLIGELELCSADVVPLRNGGIIPGLGLGLAERRRDVAPKEL